MIFFKQKTAYEMRISDWSSDVCSSDLLKHVATYHQKKYKGVLASEITHIRASSDELKLAYTCVGVPVEEMDLNIGVAPYGAYKSLKNGDDGDRKSVV